MLIRHKRGQSTLEYVVIILLVVAALVAMQVYIKRGLQGKLRASTDQIGEQFSPTITDMNTTIISGQTQRETISRGVTNTNTTRGFQNVTGSEKVGNYSAEPRI